MLVSNLRRAAVKLGLIPQTMKGKELLKRVFYGELTPIPSEISDGIHVAEPLVEVAKVDDITNYTFIFAAARKR